jgi:hypothetical protein
LRAASRRRAGRCRARGGGSDLPRKALAEFTAWLPRRDAKRITGLRERSTRDLLATLVAEGIHGSEFPEGPVSLRFPLHAIELLFPSLFPET